MLARSPRAILSELHIQRIPVQIKKIKFMRCTHGNTHRSRCKGHPDCSQRFQSAEHQMSQSQALHPCASSQIFSQNAPSFSVSSTIQAAQLRTVRLSSRLCLSLLPLPHQKFSRCHYCDTPNITGCLPDAQQHPELQTGPCGTI